MIAQFVLYWKGCFVAFLIFIYIYFFGGFVSV